MLWIENMYSITWAKLIREGGGDKFHGLPPPRLRQNRIRSWCIIAIQPEGMIMLKVLKSNTNFIALHEKTNIQNMTYYTTQKWTSKTQKIAWQTIQFDGISCLRHSCWVLIEQLVVVFRPLPGLVNHIGCDLEYTRSQTWDINVV